MAKNIVRRVFTGSGTFTVPAGVTKLVVRKNPQIVEEKNAISLGASTTLGIKGTESTAFSCGSNGNGRLGDNTVTNRSSPVAVVGGHSFIMISAFQHALALKEDGSVWSWGLNTNGQLGDNSVTPRSSPVAVVGGHSFIAVAAGTGGLSLALKSNGSVWAWGNNSAGQLGDGTVTVKSSPVAVIGGHSFISIAAGEISLALKADGSAWTWGTNAYGQLGTNNLTYRSSPVQVVGGHSFIAISTNGDTGFGHSMALKENGSVWCWGDNTYGQIGNNTSSSAVGVSSPVQVVGGHSFTYISAGHTHCLTMKSDGAAWAWGNNGLGRLGDNSITSRSSPVAVVGGHSFVSVYAGYTHSGALKYDGTLWTWGENTSGQLSSNTVTSRSSPVQIISGFIYSGSNKTSDYYILDVTPNSTITYGSGYFGTVMINGSWLIEYEA